MSGRRILRIVRKELIQLRRDPRLLRIVIMAPLFQLFVFGYAVTTDVRHVSTAVYDQDQTAASREFTERFIRSGYFDFDHYVTDPADVARLLDAGRVQMALSIERGFTKDLARNRTAHVQIILDGSDSMAAGIISGYVGGVVQAYSLKAAQERLDRVKAAAPLVPGIDGRLRVWYNPDLKSVNYMVPGVICTLLLVVTTILTSLAIVKEREIGTLEMLVVTPIKARELMLGKMVPFILVGFLDMMLVVGLGALWFRVPIAGSLLLLLALSAVFLLTSLGIGLFISTVSRTQQQAMMTGFFVILPSIILSGFMFPIENMPAAIRWITYFIPLRYYLVIIRGIFLKGNGIEILWPQVAALLVLGVAIMGTSVLRFTKRLG